ncbi:MAG: AmmeMemoRadiSam system protein A [Desulfobacterales bacterium]
MTIQTLSDDDRNSLLKLARSAIAAELVDGAEVTRPVKPSAALQEKCGCFVTLHKNKALRGCIGTIEAARSLLAGVEDNARNSAFRDPRFPPLEADELPAVDIEVSVLSVPILLEYDDADDLLKKLQPGVHGVIISRTWHSATFLPQVWEQLTDAKSFLEHLCLKAGLEKNSWKAGDVTSKVYTVEYFSE